MDRATCESRLRNLHAWAGHLRSTLEEALPRALDELGPPGEETPESTRRAASALKDVARALDDLMGAFDLLLEASGRPRRFDDLLQALAPVSGADPDDLDDIAEEDVDDGPATEIHRSRFARLAAELHFDAGWLAGGLRGALACGGLEHLDAHFDGLAGGIEEALISYDRLQGVLGALPARHDAFFDHPVILEEPRRRRRGDPD